MVEHKLSLDGAAIMWNCGPTNREKLFARMEQIGLDKFVPPVRSPQACLRLAMSEVANGMTQSMPRRKKGDSKRGYIVQSLLDPKVDGFEIVDVERKKGPNSYENVFTARVEKERIHTSQNGWSYENHLCNKFDAYRLEVDGSAIGASLVELIGHFGGTCLRAHGGVYFVPDQIVGRMYDAGQAYELANPVNQVDVLKFALDACGIRAVKRAIVKELVEEAGKIAEELRSGDLTEAGVQKRVDGAKALRQKCNSYEELLSVELTECRKMITLAETSLCSGVAVQENEDVYAGIM